KQESGIKRRSSHFSCVNTVPVNTYGIIGFNLLAPFLFEKQAGFDGNQMLWAAVTALLCAELGARVGKWLERREPS
ncbi:hypothetical protein, partial [Aeromonas caviae]|uniref:hypothetical protein n=1 Tax=Aeromonas caviae TaxID=648 RepID=UPI002B47020C